MCNIFKKEGNYMTESREFDLIKMLLPCQVVKWQMLPFNIIDSLVFNFDITIIIMSKNCVYTYLK